MQYIFFFFFSSRRRHTRSKRDWSSDVCSSDLHPPSRWPWPDAKAETRFNQWEARYLKACGERATCELLATMGNPRIGPDIQLVISIHDEATRAKSKLAL